MEWTIYSIGDSAFLEQVLNAVAMLTGTGDFNDAIRIGFLLGVLMLALQAVLRPMSMIQFQYTLVAFLVFSFLYGPGQRVLIEDAYTGDVRVVDNVPLGVAASGAIISNAGYAITKLFETAFSTPAMTTYGFGSQLDELGLIQKAFSTPAGLGRANAPRAGDDVRMSWYNYIKECTLVGVDQGTLKVDDIMRNKNVVDALRFDSNFFGTRIYIDGGAKDLSCADAWNALQAYTTGPFAVAAWDVLAAKKGLSTPGGGADAETALADALAQAGAVGVSAQDYMIANVLLPIYEDSVSGKQLDDQSIGAAIATQQAISQRDAQWAGEYTVFATVVRPMMTFLEGFTFAVTPIMGFLVAMGTFGINVAAKYVVTLLWIQLWMPTMAIVNLYLNLVINKKMAAFQAVGGMGLPIPSFGGLYELNSQIQHWLSTGGMLASSVPALTMMLVYGGSAVAATHFARRMEGGDHLDEKIMRPNVMSNGPALAVGAMSDMDRVSGMRLHGAEAAMPSLRIGDNREAALSSSRSAFESAQASFGTDLGRVASRSEGLSTALRDGESFGRKVSSSTSESDQALHAFASEIGNKVGLSDGQKAVLTSTLAGSVDASGKLGGVGGKNGGVGGKLGGELKSAFDSNTASSVERALSDSERSGRTAQFSSDYGLALARDITAGRETAVTSALSDSESSALKKSAQDVMAQERRAQETAQRSQSIGTGQDVKLSTLGNQGASMASELAQRLVGTDPALHGEAQRLAGFYQSRYGMQPDAAFFAGGMMALDRAAARGDSGANDMLVGFASRALGSDAGHQTGNAGANADLFAKAPQFGETQRKVDAAGLAPVASGAAARGAAGSRIQGALANADQAINDHRTNGADVASQRAARWGGAVDGQRAAEIEGDMLKWVESKTGMAQTTGEAAWGAMKTTSDALGYADQSIRGAVQGLMHGQGISAGVGEVMAGYHDAHQRYAVAELGMTSTQAQYWADVQMAPLERAIGTVPGGDAMLASFDTNAQASRAAVISEAGGKSVVADAIRSSAATDSEVNAKMVGSWNRAAGLLQ